MAKRKTKQEHLAAVVVSNVGPIRAYRVMLFISCWGIASKKLGRPVASVDEYSDWWKKHRATGFREQELFRQALPMYETPQPICEWLQQEDPAIFEQSAGAAAFKVGALL